MSSPSSELSQHSQFIRAGAGAGKTTQLIHSFLEFVKAFHLQHQRYPRIVITTFTRKATQEVKERLLVSALKENEKSIFEFINRKSFVHISTIHGLLSLYLSQYGDLLSLPHEIKIVDGSQYLRTLKKNIHTLMKRQTDYVNLLESYPFAQLVDLSRKALDLRAQYAQLTFVTSSELQKITQDKLAFVQSHIQAIFELVPDVPEKWGPYFLYLKEIENCIQTENESELLQILETSVRKPNWSAAKPAFDEKAHELIEELREIDIFLIQDTKLYRTEHEKLNSLFARFVQDLYALDLQHKQRTGELTISDLENLSLQLANEYPNSAREFSDSWDYFMIDEYQDTSPLQVSLLNQLVRGKPCFIVGDPQQSIYLFRGARSEVFNLKEAELKSKNITTRILDRNYRSEPTLMNFMNDFFKSFSTQFESMQVREAKKERQITTDAYYIKTYDEDHAVLKQIQNFIQQGVSAKDICVLSKSNLRLTEIAQKAQDFHVPVQLQAAQGFEGKREILDVISFLKFLVNPHDNENLVTLVRSPWLHIEDEVLFKICQAPESKEYSIWSAILKQTHSLIKTKDQLQFYLKCFESMGASLALKEMLQKTGFVAFSNLLDATGKREANIWKFLTTLADAEKENGFSLGLFLEDRFQSLQSDLGSAGGEAQPVIQPNCVSLMTVHASKGLEFKNIIVIGLTDKPKVTNQIQLAFDPQSIKFSLSVFDQQESALKASLWSQQIRKELNQRELSENERVLYVAMTRAQESITLIAEVPREGERKVIYKDSWFKKISWPADEESQNTKDYAVQALLYDDQMTHLDLMSMSAVSARKKLFEPTEKAVQEQSVTNLLAGSENSPEIAKTDFQKLAQSLKKAQKGTELHRLFEAMKYRSLDFLKNAMSPSEQGMVQYLLSQSEIDLPQILKKGFNEWGFGLKIKKGVLQGQIDAWAELESEIHVLDYKTGSSEYHQKAFEQLGLYTQALIKMKQISLHKKITHSVLYPTEQKIIKRSFNDAASFEKQLNPQLRELFD